MDIDVLAIAAVAITVVLFVLLSYLGRKKNVDFGILTILALVFGIVIGIIFKGHVELTAVFGRIYTKPDFGAGYSFAVCKYYLQYFVTG